MKRLAIPFLTGSLLVSAAHAGFGQDVDTGETYRSLEALATKVTTRYVDAVAITERGPGKDLRTRLLHQDGRVLGQLSYLDRSMLLEVSFPAGAQSPYETQRLLLASPSADWANDQMYSLYLELKDPAASKSTGLEQVGKLFRLAGTDAGKRAPELAKRIHSITTEFGDVQAQTVKDPQPAERKEGVAYSTFTTYFTAQTGASLGLMRWFEESRVLVWSFPGLSEGFVDDQRIPGGFPFQPTLAWSNVQGFAFWKLHRERNEAFNKNTPGCDGLHWLDDTIFRPCCDQHDLCYESNNCSVWSWFFLQGWQCSLCNLRVVGCFVTAPFGGGGGGGIGGGGIGGGGFGGGGCYYQNGYWCEASCSHCIPYYWQGPIL